MYVPSPVATMRSRVSPNAMQCMVCPVATPLWPYIYVPSPVGTMRSRVFAQCNSMHGVPAVATPLDRARRVYSIGTYTYMVAAAVAAKELYIAIVL